MQLIIVCTMWIDLVLNMKLKQKRNSPKGWFLVFFCNSIVYVLSLTVFKMLLQLPIIVQ